MSENKRNPQLSGNYKLIWELGEQAINPVGPHNMALIKTPSGVYLMIGDQGFFSEPDEEVLSAEVSWKLVAASEEFHEFQPEILPKMHPIYGLSEGRPAEEAHWSQCNPALYLLEGGSFRAYETALLSEPYNSFAVLLLDQNYRPLGQLASYPSWHDEMGNGERAEFFAHRRITSGSHYCNCLNEEVVDLLLARPDPPEEPVFETVKEIIDFTRSYAASSDQSIDNPVYSDRKNSLSQCGSNMLFYNADEGAFEFEANLIAESATETQLFIAIRNLLNLVFDHATEAKEIEENFTAYLSRKLGVSEAALYEQLSGIGELFFDHDRRFASYKAWWIDPSSVNIRIRKFDIDPSFGTSREVAIENYREYRANWMKTDFKRVSPSAFLTRLRSQSRLTSQP